MDTAIFNNIGDSRRGDRSVTYYMWRNTRGLLLRFPVIILLIVTDFIGKTTSHIWLFFPSLREVY